MVSIDRILALLKDSGKPASAVAKATGIARANFSEWKSGRSSEPNYGTVVKLAQYFHVSIDYLLGKTDSPEPVDDLLSRLRRAGAEVYPAEEMVRVPVYATTNAGFGHAVSDVCESADYDFAETEYVERRYTTGGNTFFYRIKGDSMTGDNINDGDFVFIRETPVVNNWDIAAVNIRDDFDNIESTIKHVRYAHNSIELHPSNPKYQPQIFRGKDRGNVEIVGKVVFQMHKF